MGKTYYAGVPGMHEQFGPVVTKAVQNGLYSGSKHKHGKSPSYGYMLMILLFGLPIMPIWSGFMLIGELFRLGSEDKEVRNQSAFNIKFAAVFFVIGCIFYNWAFNTLRY